MNRKVVLASRPDGVPTAANFRLVQAPVPELADGAVLIATDYLSIDAFIRTTLDDRPGFHGQAELEAPVMALGVGRVVASRFPGLAEGDSVFGPIGAQTHAVMPGGMYRKLPAGDLPPKTWLGLLGMTTGLTAYVGMLTVGEVVSGDTVVVSAAAGAVGSVACQLAKIAGARVIGIAGGSAKCDFLVNTLGCDGAVDYKAGDVGARLAAHAPNGVNVFFDNVGGEILDAVLLQLAPGARVVLCGAISQYNRMGEVRGPVNYLKIAERNASMRGFTVDRYADDFARMEADIVRWIGEARLTMPEHVVTGIENFPTALGMLFNGGHRGKLLVAP
ncbi:MAG: NADP-dependent oxidoreductase [Pseudomonadales bacterium]